MAIPVSSLSSMKPWKQDLRWGSHCQLFEDIKWRRPSRLLHHLHTPSCRVCMSRLSYTALPQYPSDQLERLQKWALRMISTHDLSYRQSLQVFNIPTLYERREAIGNSMFQEISNNNNHRLYSLLLPSCQHEKIASSKSRVLKQSF